MRKTTKLKELILAPEILLMPAPHDVLSAKIMEKVGFKALCVGGYAVSATLLGAPDIGLLSMSEMVEHFARMAEAVEIPLMVDGDTGHGNVLNVVRLIKKAEKAGAAGIFIEDQVFPKRCGHMAGKQIVSREEMLAKLRAALDARCDPDFVIMARTDALAVHGLDEAIERARLYREAGADVIFLEAPRSVEDMRRINREIDAPTLANIIEGGKTPELGASQLQELGFNVVIFPTTATYAVAKAVFEVMSVLYRQGGTEGLRDSLYTFEEFNNLVGLPALRSAESGYHAK